MKFIKPHLDIFFEKYYISFDGNDYWIQRARKVLGNNGGHYAYPDSIWAGWKWLALLRLAIIRRGQWREMERENARASKSINPPKILPY